MSDKPFVDIKGALNQIIPLNLRSKDQVQRTIKSDSTTDRDANGQQSSGDPNQHQKEPMSEEQLQKALEHLKALPAVTENHLEFEVTQKDGRYLVLLKEPGGKVVRRIPDSELWTLQIMRADDKRGQILNKSA